MGGFEDLSYHGEEADYGQFEGERGFVMKHYDNVLVELD